LDLQAIQNFDLNRIDRQFVVNPHPTLAALREHDPMHVNPDGSIYLTRHADVLATYRHKDMLSDKKVEFGRKFGDGPLLTHHTTSLIFNDPPYHTVVRKLLAAAFTPRKLEEMDSLIREIVDGLLDRMADMGTLDFIAEFASALPTEIISVMLGIPRAHRHKLRGYSVAILGALDPVVSAENLAKGNAAVTEFSALLSDLIALRRANPGQAQQGQVLDGLIFGEIDGRRLSDIELVQNCIFLLNAGHETTASTVGNGLAVLLDNPDQHRLLMNDPDLIVSAVEEILRLQSPLQIGNRLAKTDIDLPSGKIAAGTYIHTSIAGANRDPAVFVAPDTVDITRQPNRHLAFITGIHVCLGATLARMEARMALGRLVARFPQIRANGGFELLGLARFRGHRKMPVAV